MNFLKKEYEAEISCLRCNSTTFELISDTAGKDTGEKKDNLRVFVIAKGKQQIIAKCATCGRKSKLYVNRAIWGFE
jgi:transcription elongation factor Elf1